MKRVAALVLAACGFALGETAPTTMTILTVKFESPNVRKDGFAAQPKRIYRAGSGYCRIEENPDLENGIHGLIIINEPDTRMINRLDKTARHFPDPGPTYNCRLPMFVDRDDVKTPDDLKKPMTQLEFGRELEYFRSKSDKPSAGPVRQGKETLVYTVQLGEWQLFLFTSGKPEVPVAVARKSEKTREIYWYGEYADVAFDPKLFAKPEGVKIEEEH